MRAYGVGVTADDADRLDGLLHDVAEAWMIENEISIDEATLEPPAWFLQECAAAWRDLVWSHAGHFEIHDYVLRPLESGFFVYRLWRESEHLPNRLVYVGSTRRLASRLVTHERRLAGLWSLATWRSYPDAASMLAAEAEAIQAESPAMNLAGV